MANLPPLAAVGRNLSSIRLHRALSRRRTTRPCLWVDPHNLNKLSAEPHRDVRSLAKTYGPILHLRLGSVPTIFVSSLSLMREVVKDNDLLFPGRPHSVCAEELSYGFKGFGSSDCGPYWRGARKMCVSHLFTPSKLQSHLDLRKREMDALVAELKDAAAARSLVDVTAKVA